MDGVLVINGVADTVARDIRSLADMPDVAGGQWVEAEPGKVFGGFAYKDGTFSPPVTPPTPVDPFANFIPVPMVRQRVEKLGMWEAFAGYIAQYPPLWLKILSLESGVDPAYPEFSAAFDEMQVPQIYRDYILAPPSAGVGDPPPLG